MKKIFVLSLAILTVGQSFGHSWNDFASSLKETATIAGSILSAEAKKGGAVVSKKSSELFTVVSDKSAETFNKAKAAYPGVQAKAVAKINQGFNASVEYAKNDPASAAIISAAAIVGTWTLYECYKAYRKSNAVQRARADLYYHECRDGSY
ncbi:MAG TPA: hypothetical protein QGF02_02250 [Candidatus Babeliales bacterium]|nr:hypothetical protein [Candidatus Babeliales bacterium]